MTKDQFRGLDFYRKLRPELTARSFLVYGGDEVSQRYGHQVLPWRAVPRISSSDRDN